MQTILLALSLTVFREGIKIDNSSAIIAITTSSSINVKALVGLVLRFRLILSCRNIFLSFPSDKNLLTTRNKAVKKKKFATSHTVTDPNYNRIIAGLSRFVKK